MYNYIYLLKSSSDRITYAFWHAFCSRYTLEFYWKTSRQFNKESIIVRLEVSALLRCERAGWFECVWALKFSRYAFQIQIVARVFFFFFFFIFTFDATFLEDSCSFMFGISVTEVFTEQPKIRFANPCCLHTAFSIWYIYVICRFSLYDIKVILDFCRIFHDSVDLEYSFPSLRSPFIASTEKPRYNDSFCSLDFAVKKNLLLWRISTWSGMKGNKRLAFGYLLQETRVVDIC